MGVIAGMDKTLEDFSISDAALPLVMINLDLAVKSSVTGNNAIDASKFSGITLSMCRHVIINNQTSNDNDVAAAMATQSGATIIRCLKLLQSVLESKRVHALPDSTHEFFEEQKKYAKVPIDFLIERFAQLKTSDRDVVVTPSPPSSGWGVGSLIEFALEHYRACVELCHHLEGASG